MCWAIGGQHHRLAVERNVTLLVIRTKFLKHRTQFDDKISHVVVRSKSCSAVSLAGSLFLVIGSNRSERLLKGRPKKKRKAEQKN